MTLTDADEHEVPAWVGQAGPVPLPASMRHVDPEVAEAIMACMKGSWLYKYARTLGVGAERRHARYFFLNPYTQTIHWADAAPAGAAGAVAKSKGTYIEHVALMDDRNPHPSGLYHQTIVVRTGRRELKFTAPDKSQHRLWCTALGFLLQKSDSAVSVGSGASRVAIPLELGGRPDSLAALRSPGHDPTLRSDASMRTHTARIVVPDSGHAAASPGTVHRSVSRHPSLAMLGDPLDSQRLVRTGSTQVRSSRRANPDTRLASGPMEPVERRTSRLSALWRGQRG